MNKRDESAMEMAMKMFYVVRILVLKVEFLSGFHHFVSTFVIHLAAVVGE